VRSDTNLNKQFAGEGVDTREYGSMPGVLDTSTTVEGRGRVLRSHSFSGHETDSVFYNVDGGQFVDISGVSGMDSIADGRGFAYFDYDRDGWQDVVLVNSNAPQLELFRNRIGDIAKQSGAVPGNAIQVRLRGGNAGSRPMTGSATLEGYGAHVLLKAGAHELRRELRCGDGFAAQNSATVHVGIGKATAAEELRVVWPSGKITAVGRVEAGATVSVNERPADGQPVFTLSAPAAASLPQREIPDTSPREQLDLAIPSDGARLRVFTMMATWCAVCQSELPHLSLLRKKLPQGEVALYGVPVDGNDTRAQLDAYAARHSPAYQILVDMPESEREKIRSLFRARFNETPLPATMVTTAAGDVLLLKKGTVDLSGIRQLLHRMQHVAP